jgi:hypothetical protein
LSGEVLVVVSLWQAMMLALRTIKAIEANSAVGVKE